MRALIRLAAIAAAFCAFLIAPASAAGRNDIYAVAGVRADATAANAQVARATAVAAAQRAAFDRLVRRLVTDQDYARLGAPKPDDVAIDRLVSGIDIADERRSGTRYLATLAVNFDSAAVRAYLTQAGFTLVETRAPPALIVAQMPDAAPGLSEAWRQAFEQGGYSQELAPVTVAPATVTGPPAWPTAQSAAAAAGAASAIFATARTASGMVVADLVEVGPSGARTERGQVSAPLGTGDAALSPALQKLAEAVVGRLQADWKQTLASGGGQRTRITVTAVFSSREQWAQIKRALSAATTTIVSDVRIDGVARDGALISFSYVGAPAQLAAEFGRSGVDAVSDGATMTLRVRG
ncbi:MAG: DUF2066 domain-containing protein [Alphaproteobacteria bacterium]|nr:DUF2066 domain-containing protein [Alphaproteobacteria bacterium]